MKYLITLYIMIFTSSAFAVPLPAEDARPAVTLSNSFEGIWTGTIDIKGCKADFATPILIKKAKKKKIVARLCVGPDSDGNADRRLTGKVTTKTNLKILQDDAKVKAFPGRATKNKKSRIIDSMSLDLDNDSEIAFTLLKGRKGRTANVTFQISEFATDLYPAGSLVFTYGNCVSGYFSPSNKKANPKCN